MIKKLVKIGKSVGIILDKTLLELVGANENTFVEIEIKDKSIILTPTNKNNYEK